MWVDIVKSGWRVLQKNWVMGGGMQPASQKLFCDFPDPIYMYELTKTVNTLIFETIAAGTVSITKFIKAFG